MMSRPRHSFACHATAGTVGVGRTRNGTNQNLPSRGRPDLPRGCRQPAAATAEVLVVEGAEALEARVCLVIGDQVTQGALRVIRLLRQRGSQVVLVAAELDDTALVASVEAGGAGVGGRGGAAPDRRGAGGHGGGRAG